MKKIIVLSVILNIVFVGYFITKRMVIEKEPIPVPIVKFPELKYWLNRQNYLAKLPISEQDIVFVGDSHTQQFELEEMFQNLHIKNRGINKDVSQRVLERIEPVLAGKPKDLFLMIGINDILQSNSINVLVSNVKRMIDLAKLKTPKTKFYIESILPTKVNIYLTNKPSYENIVSANNKLKLLAKVENVTYIDLFTLFEKNNILNPDFDCGDGLHLNYAGYSKWKSIVERYIF